MRHTGHVGVHAVMGTRPDKAERFLALQGDRGAFDILLAEGRDIVLKGHGHTSHQIVQDRDRVHGEGKVVIHRRTGKQACHRQHDVLAAVVFTGSEGMRQGDLHLPIPADQAVDREPGHIADGITVDLEGRHGLTVMVEDHQEEKVGKIVIVKSLDLVRVSLCFHDILSDQKDALQAALYREDLSFVLDKAGIVTVHVILGVRDLGLLLLGDEHRRKQQKQSDKIDDQDDDFAAFCFEHRALHSFKKIPRPRRAGDLRHSCIRNKRCRNHFSISVRIEMAPNSVR